MCLSMDCKPSNSEHVRIPRRRREFLRPSCWKWRIRPWLSLQRKVKVYFPQTNEPLWAKWLTDATLSKRQKGFTKVKVQYFFTGCRFYPFGFRFPWPYITCGGQESITKLMARASSDAKMNGQMWKCEIQKKTTQDVSRNMSSEKSAKCKVQLGKYYGDVVGWRFTCSLGEVFIYEYFRNPCFSFKSTRAEPWLCRFTYQQDLCFEKRTEKSQACKSSKSSIFNSSRTFKIPCADHLFGEEEVQKRQANYNMILQRGSTEKPGLLADFFGGRSQS